MIEIIILILAFPVGFLIAWLAHDELVQGRRYLGILIIASFSAGIWFYLIGEKTLLFSSLFILIVAAISFVKSYTATP